MSTTSTACGYWSSNFNRSKSFTHEQTPTLNVISEYIIGYLYPGYPVANICFKVYGYISLKQGIAFLQDFKLGHYMKIPPRAMFMAQVSILFILFHNYEWKCAFVTF